MEEFEKYWVITCDNEKSHNHQKLFILLLYLLCFLIAENKELFYSAMDTFYHSLAPHLPKRSLVLPSFYENLNCCAKEEDVGKLDKQ